MQHKVIIAQNNALVFLSCLTKEKKTEMALIPLLLTSKKSMIWHSIKKEDGYKEIYNNYK